MEDVYYFEDIIKDLKRVRKGAKLNKLDDNVLFDSAVRIYNSIIINKLKYNKRNGIEFDVNAPMTERQKKLLEDLGYNGDVRLTKIEATRIIKERLSQRHAAM